VTERLVVVGGNAAGMSAASQLRRRRSADDIEIVAFERGGSTSYSACGIPYWVGDVVDERDRLVVRTPQRFAEQDIDAHVGHEVVEVDLDARRLRVRDLSDGGERDEPFDQVLFATGARPIRPPLPGIDGPGVHGVQTRDDGAAIIERLHEGARHAVVIGAGYIGLEMAEAFVMRGLDVHLVERSDRPMRTVDADMGERIAASMDDMGITLHLDTRAEAIEHDGDGRLRAVVTGSGELPADVVVLGIGAEPDVGLADRAGVPIGESGAIEVDLRQRTLLPGVWAAGDCAEVRHRVSRRPTAIALGTIANKTGRIAGINLGGGYATFPGVLGTAATKVCGLEVARTGLGEHDAEQAGYAPVCATIGSTTRAGYWPDARELTIKVIAERGSGRLLGAQIVGEEGAAKRIDVFAAALWSEMVVEELLNLDLSYAPPFAPVWDPVLIAARKAWDAVEADVRG
jgi:NADPH-dependent 2,4-dienoyl-CoA reductase/sulfur reductase-like enzyme